MGFNDINLQVSGPQQPASTYKTKVLKGQVPFATQVTEPNTKYVIKHNFVLNGDVTIPSNCILEFDGGSISGAKINNLCNITIKPSYFNLSEGDDISTIWGTGWKNIIVDFDNLPLTQTDNISITDCTYCKIYNLNVQRYNYSYFSLVRVKDAEISHCSVDGTPSGTDYDDFTTSGIVAYYGFILYQCNNAVVSHNNISNICGRGGIRVEGCNRTLIAYNYLHNVRWKIHGSDTEGDGIYVALSVKTDVVNNTIIVDDGVQIPRCAIVYQYTKGGIVADNIVTGADRGIHFELFNTSGNVYEEAHVVRNNRVTRSMTAFLAWNTNDAPILVEGNYFSCEGCTATNSLSGWRTAGTTYQHEGNVSGVTLINNTIIHDINAKDSNDNPYKLFSTPQCPVVMRGNIIKSNDNSDINKLGAFTIYQQGNTANISVEITDNVIECGQCIFNIAKGRYTCNKLNFWLAAQGVMPVIGQNTNLDNLEVIGNVFNPLKLVDGTTQIIAKSPKILKNNIIGTPYDTTRYTPLFLTNGITEGSVFDGNTIICNGKFIPADRDFTNTYRAWLVGSAITETDNSQMRRLAEGKNTFVRASDKHSVTLDNQTFEISGFIGDSFSKSGPTANRPTGLLYDSTENTYSGNLRSGFRRGTYLNALDDVGFEYFDTTLGKPIYAKEINYSTGVVTWVDATGETV